MNDEKHARKMCAVETVLILEFTSKTCLGFRSISIDSIWKGKCDHSLKIYVKKMEANAGCIALNCISARKKNEVHILVVSYYGNANNGLFWNTHSIPAIARSHLSPGEFAIQIKNLKHKTKRINYL